MSKDEPVNKEAADAVVNFLKTNVPKSDVPNVEAELKKDFVLAKVKGKKHKREKHKKKTKSLTRKQRKVMGFYSIPRDSVKYEEALPLYHMWEEYMCKILEPDKPIPNCNSKAWDSFTQTIYKADFHGSLLRVIRSKCASYVGKTGICIMDTRNTFKIVSRNHVTTTIPKKECVFELYFKDYKITLFGKHVAVRPAERSTKKVKSHLHPDL